MATALDAIKSTYPARYYGVVASGGTSLSAVYDVWTATDLRGATINVLGLVAATEMAPLSGAQWTLAQEASMSGLLTVPVSGLVIQYPDRFYCDKNAPCAVYDMWAFSSPPTVPAIGDLYAITASEYADRQTNYREQYYDTATRKLADYVAPVVVATLADQATAALSTARTYVSNNYTMLNETTPDAWVTYLKALMAIANGTDTTSTALPSAPAP